MGRFIWWLARIFCGPQFCREMDKTLLPIFQGEDKALRGISREMYYELDARLKGRFGRPGYGQYSPLVKGSGDKPTTSRPSFPRSGVASGWVILFALLAVPAFAQAPAASPTPAPEPCEGLNCGSARVRLAAAGVVTVTDATTSDMSIVGTLEGDLPIVVNGKAWMRPYGAFRFYGQPGAAVPTPSTWNAIELEGGGTVFLSNAGGAKFGASCAIWANFKLNYASATVQPLVPNTGGWGCGVTIVAPNGLFVTVKGGQDSFGSTDGTYKVGARLIATVPIPQTSTTKSNGPIGSFYIDARVATSSVGTVVPAAPAPAVPSGPAAAAPVPVATSAPLQLTKTLMVGVRVDATAAWGAIFGAVPAAAPAVARVPEISKVSRASLQFGPPVPRGRWDS